LTESGSRDIFAAGKNAMGTAATGAGTTDERTCMSCAHFVDDPGALEVEFPYLSVFGSAYSSARGLAGMCQRLQRFMDPLPANRCPSFTPRAETTGRE
jgi:hypothetical protein